METTKITLKTLAVSIFAVVGLEIADRMIGTGHILPPLIGLGILRLLEIFLLTGICLWIEKNIAVIGLASKMWAGFLKGLLWSACFAVAAVIIAGALYIAGMDPVVFFRHPLPAAQARHPLILLIVGGVIAPVAEEIFFRGILYGFFRSRGIITAIVISTVLFVLPHLNGNTIPLTQAVGGIVFALAYEKEKNLLTPITIHCLGNLTLFGLTFVC